LVSGVFKMSLITNITDYPLKNLLLSDVLPNTADVANKIPASRESVDAKSPVRGAVSPAAGGGVGPGPTTGG
jgi:hypothetical protein